MASASDCSKEDCGRALLAAAQSSGIATDCPSPAGTFNQLYVELDAMIQKRHHELRDHVDSCMARQEQALQELSGKFAPWRNGEFIHSEPQQHLSERPTDNSEAWSEEFSESLILRQTSGGKCNRSSSSLSNPRFSHFRLDDELKRKSARAIKSAKELPDYRQSSGPRRWYVYLHTKAREAVENPWFDSLSALLIISNAIVLGLQVEFSASQNAGYGIDAWNVVQYSYCFLFLCELLLRMLALGSDFFHGSGSGWNYLDLIIVIVSIFEMIVELSNRSSGTLMNMMAVRIIRLVRIVRVTRVLRLLRFFRSLRLLAHSIFATLKSLVWAMLLLGMIMYMFGLVLAQAATDHLLESSNPVLNHYYGSLPKAVFTLFKSISGGVNWEDVASPLSHINAFYAVLFIVYIVLAMFAVLNVMTGHFCQSAIESAERDHNEVVHAQLTCTKLYTERLQQLFKDLDEGPGAFTLETFEAHIQDSRVKAYFETLEIDVTDAWTLFKLLDPEGKNVIDMSSFVEGCLRLRGFAKTLNVKELMYEINWMNDSLARFIQHANSQFTALADADRRIFECMSIPGSRRDGLSPRLSSPGNRGRPAKASSMAL